jgi:formyltetrahydrofolate deformylase
MSNTVFVLTLACPNRPGIVAAVATAIFEQGGNILEAQQYDDTQTNRFLARTVLDHPRDALDPAALRAALGAVAARFDMQWALRDKAQRHRVMLMVSKFDHCLADILYRWRLGELPMEITAVVSNHPRETYGRLDFSGVPFHHLPVTRESKAAQEARLLDLVEETGSELVVLARYMQVLSDDLAGKLSGRCINIHHSFLPGFKGAKPYHQAHVRALS